MPTYQEYDPETGQTYEVWEPNPMEHLPARGRGTPTAPGEVTERPVTMGQAFTVGRYRENPEELQAKLGGEVKEENGRLYWKPEGETTWSNLNAPGLRGSDFARMAGESIGPTAGAAATRLLAQAATKNPWVRFLSYGAGGGLGSLINEAIQYGEGTQRESVEDLAVRAGQDATLELIGGGLGDWLGHVARGRPLTVPHSRRAAEELEQAIEFQQGQPLRPQTGINQAPPTPSPPEYPAPLPLDILQRTGVDPIPGVGLPGGAVRGIGAQAEGASGRISGVRRDMAHQAQQAVEGEFVLPPQQREVAENQLARAAAEERQWVRGDIERAGPGAEAGAAAGEAAAREGNERIRGAIGAQYGGPLADALSREQPIYDLSPVQKGWPSPKLSKTELVQSNILDADGHPILDNVTRELELIESPTGKIKYLRDLLASFDTRQQGPEAFHAIKELRTMVGGMLGDPAFRDAAERPARRLYGELSEILENPVNKADTPDYLKEFGVANTMTKWHAGLLEDNAVRKALKTHGAAPFLRQLAKDPESILSPKFRELLDFASPEQKTQMRLATQQAILDTPDPAATLDKLPIASNPEAFDFLFDNPKQRMDFLAQADRVSKFKNSTLGKVYDQRNKQFDTLEFALGDIKTRRDAQRLWDSMPEADRPMIQEAILDGAVNKALKPTKGDELVIRPEILTQQIEDLKKRGLWGLLSPEQQKRLVGARSYYRVVLGSVGDLGSSLENASVNAAIKDMLFPVSPGTVGRAVEAYRTLGVNRALAKYLTNPKRTQKLLKRLKASRKPDRTVPWGIYPILGAPYVAGTTEEEAINLLLPEEE